MGEDAAMDLEAMWPLFGLRLRVGDVELRLPTDDEVAALCALAKGGIHDADEMPFGVAWTDAPSPAFERGFVQHHWEARARFGRDDWHLALVTFVDDRPIGAQSLLGAAFPERRTVHTGSWLGRDWQGRGIGKAMRSAVLGLAFDHLGAEVAETEAFVDNLASSGVSRALGYLENGYGRLTPRGLPRETLRFRMTLDDWRARPRPAIEVTGLEAAREIFGV